MFPYPKKVLDAVFPSPRDIMDAGKRPLESASAPLGQKKPSCKDFERHGISIWLEGLLNLPEILNEWEVD